TPPTPHGGVSGLERGRSEASSMLSEVPDYLFGLDNSDDTPTRPTTQGSTRSPRQRFRFRSGFSLPDCFPPRLFPYL
ncbi:hypothetical protein VIGAN_02005500, partial [Vigna angularis var. angularis]